MASAAYVAEDGLIRHQWEERSLVLWRLDRWPSIGELRTGKWEWVGRWRNTLKKQGRGWDRGFLGGGQTWKRNNIWNVNKENIQQKFENRDINDMTLEVFLTFSESYQCLIWVFSLVDNEFLYSFPFPPELASSQVCNFFPNHNKLFERLLLGIWMYPCNTAQQYKYHKDKGILKRYKAHTHQGSGDCSVCRVVGMQD
jgi:hypothetical protein